MSHQLVDQINIWWKTVSDKELLNTYQKTLQTTWNILRETAKLAWLFLCLGLVLVTWIGTSSKDAGQQIKGWYQSIQEPKLEHIWSEAGQFLIAASRTTATQMMTQAREQLGLPTPETGVKNPVPKTVPVAAAVKPIAASEPAAPIANPEVKAEEES